MTLFGSTAQRLRKMKSNQPGATDFAGDQQLMVAQSDFLFDPNFPAKSYAKAVLRPSQSLNINVWRRRFSDVAPMSLLEYHFVKQGFVRIKMLVPSMPMGNGLPCGFSRLLQNVRLL